MFKPYYDIRGKIGAKDLLPLTSASTLANKVLDMGLIDMMMFSINPMYDYGQGDFSIGSNAERYELYSRCEKKGVGISVMKPFNAGQLKQNLSFLDATEEEKDYSIIGSFTPDETKGKCVYCNSRSPFSVDQMKRMREIEEYFR